MPYHVEFDTDAGVFRTTFSGVVTDEDAVESARERFRHPAFPECRFFWTDHTGIERLDVTADGAQRLSELIGEAARVNPGLRCVSILPKTDQYGMGRLFQGYSPDEETGWDTFIARSRREAREWLASAAVDPAHPSSDTDFTESDP